MNSHCQNGFTLLELIMVIMIVALASVPILGQFTRASSILITDEVIQTAAQLAQERAEDILSERRLSGYAAITTGTTNDVLTAPFNNFSRRVVVTSPPAGGGCAAGATCKEVVVSVDHSGRTRAAITFVLVNY